MLIENVAAERNMFLSPFNYRTWLNILCLHLKLRTVFMRYKI